MTTVFLLGGSETAGVGRMGRASLFFKKKRGGVFRGMNAPAPSGEKTGGGGVGGVSRARPENKNVARKGNRQATFPVPRGEGPGAPALGETNADPSLTTPKLKGAWGPVRSG